MGRPQGHQHLRRRDHLGLAVPVIAALVLVAAVAALRLTGRSGVSVRVAQRAAAVGCREVEAAYQAHAAGRWLTLAAPVLRLLQDATSGFKHQRFILRCSSGLTVLVENDLTFGQRAPVAPGVNVVVRGEYIWNSLGGLMHDTHRRDTGSSGWIFVGGRIFD